MWVDDYSLRLTKHGRMRFLERVGDGYSDAAILALAYVGLPGYKMVWKPDARLKKAYRLVTVLYEDEGGRPVGDRV